MIWSGCYAELGITASLVHTREVFKAASLANSSAIIVNHPTGSLEASREDIQTTETLIKAGQILGVTLVDHVIVSSNGLQSLRELKPHTWLQLLTDGLRLRSRRPGGFSLCPTSRASVI